MPTVNANLSLLKGMDLVLSEMTAIARTTIALGHKLSPMLPADVHSLL
jgi:hypothetical protein